MILRTCLHYTNFLANCKPPTPRSNRIFPFFSDQHFHQMEPKVRRTSPGFAGWAKIFNLWFQWVAIALNLRKILRILEASWSHLHAPPGRVKVVPLDGRPFPSPSDKSGSPQMTGGTWEDILDVCITLHYTVYKRLGSWNVVKTKASKALLFCEHFPTLTCWHHRFWRIGTRSVWIND